MASGGEIRAIRDHVDAKEFIQLIKLFEGRLTYLSMIQKPIPVTINSDSQKNFSKKVQDFADYVTESGIALEDFLRAAKIPEPYLSELRKVTQRPPTIFCKKIFNSFW